MLRLPGLRSRPWDAQPEARGGGRDTYAMGRGAGRAAIQTAVRVIDVASEALIGREARRPACGTRRAGACRIGRGGHAADQAASAVALPRAGHPHGARALHQVGVGAQVHRRAADVRLLAGLNRAVHHVSDGAAVPPAARRPGGSDGRTGRGPRGGSRREAGGGACGARAGACGSHPAAGPRTRSARRPAVAPHRLIHRAATAREQSHDDGRQASSHEQVGHSVSAPHCGRTRQSSAGHPAAP
jgi:hypothetical protein